MTFTEREAHIKQLGEQMLAAHARYEASGCFSDIGEAHGLPHPNATRYRPAKPGLHRGA